MTAMASEALHSETSVDKALVLLDAFGTSEAAVGVSELARRAGLPKSTAFRLLATLEAHRLVVRRGRQYSLGHRLFELGQRVSYCQPASLRDMATPYLADLYQLSHETVRLAVLDGAEVAYIHDIHGHASVRSIINIGCRLPALCTAAGKAMLAFAPRETAHMALEQGLRRRTPFSIVAPNLLVAQLRRIRQSGVAFDHEECRVGLVCVAAPVLDADGTAVAAISMTGRGGNFAAEKFAPSVQKAAAAVSRAYAAARAG
jgi:IclR family KDG regulon transcriptional repressor